MPWGKHQGQRLDEVPLSYLAWVLEEARNPDASLRRAIRDEVAARLGIAAPPAPRNELPPAHIREAAAALIAAGWRGAAKQAHPDAGGSHALMLSLGEARDWLQRAVGAA